MFITESYLQEVKEQATFETYEYEDHPFKDYSYEDLRHKLGLKGIPITEEELPLGQVDDTLPTNFVSRDKWPHCVHEIRDQARCGSCWAFSASEVVSDRFCIASSEKVDEILSPQDMVSCDKQDMGCMGGYLDRSWNYLQNTGIVTDACMPYTSGGGQTAACPTKCADGSPFQKYKVKNVRMPKSVQEIKTEIFTNGPVETGFLVYADFMSYKSGIYVKSSNQLMGGHAVKIVGWGTENGTDYWVVANSWGGKWGEAGHFRFKQSHCCNFESQVITADPAL